MAMTLPDLVPIPGLLRAARNTYAGVIREALAEVDCEDVPRNGIFVIASIVRFGSPLGEIIRALAVSKQAAGQLIDTLVLRGYLERAVDPADRRRLTLTATARGEAAAAASGAAVARLEAELTAQVGADCVAMTRRALGALAMMGETRI